MKEGYVITKKVKVEREIELEYFTTEQRARDRYKKMEDKEKLKIKKTIFFT